MIKFSDYTGSLAIPKIFPGVRKQGISGYPEALTDGYIVDFHASKDDRVRVAGTVPKPPVDNILSGLGKDILSEPKYVVEGYYTYFILFNLEEEPVGIQLVYYQYFKGKYKGCEFVGSGKMDPVGVIKDGEVVGLIMPIRGDTGCVYE